MVRDSWYGFSFDISAEICERTGHYSPVDILPDVVNLDICETVGLDSCLNEVLQVRVIVNGRIDFSLSSIFIPGSNPSV